MNDPHAARNTDPVTSHAAAMNRSVKWASLRGIALRVHYAARNNADGLTDYECEISTKGFGGLGACGWKRIGELRTEYSPPLIVPVIDKKGNVVSRAGEYGDKRIAYTITSAGILTYLNMAAKSQPQA